MIDAHAWIAIAFFAFLYFVYKPVRNSILGALDKKIAQIQVEVEKAQELPLEAERLLEQVKTDIKNADKQLERDLQESKAEIGHIIKEKNLELENILKQKAIDSEQRINHLTENAIKQIHSEQIESAVNIVTNYLHNAPKKNDLTDLELAKKLLLKSN